MGVRKLSPVIADRCAERDIGDRPVRLHIPATVEQRALNGACAADKAGVYTCKQAPPKPFLRKKHARSDGAGADMRRAEVISEIIPDPQADAHARKDIERAERDGGAGQDLSPQIVEAEPGDIGAEFADNIIAETDRGRAWLLRALARQASFEGQRVRVEIGGTPLTMTVAGEALFDATGGFTGFRGIAVRDPETTGAAPTSGTIDPAFGSLPLSDPQFGRRIDGALRGPLSRIIATAETIHGQFDGPIRADYARYAGDIAHAGRHLLGLVDDLADLQNIERPGFKAARDEIDLGDLARRAVGLLGMKAEEKGIRIDAPRTDDRMPAYGEFRRVLQVLLNLLGNAIRYSPEQSQIWIRVDREGDRAMVTVADQGQGIATDQQAVVFEKFERLGRTDSGGSGLGLYIARRLARAMGGDLTVDSAPGQGARFTLSLPAREA